MKFQPKDWTVEYFLANESDCTRILEDPVALKEIPSLNGAPLDQFKDGQLVRFQGMLQDMHNPEYYYKRYEVLDTRTGKKTSRCGTYKDGAICEKHEQILMDSHDNENSERQTWFVISTPGLNDWAKEKCTRKVNSDVQPTDSGTSLSKRPLDEKEEPMDCSEPVRKKAPTSVDDAGPSQPKDNIATPSIVSKDHILNFPIPNEGGISCLVKIYKDFSYKLNQIIDIVGFLSLDPSLSIVHDSEEMADNLEMQTHHPPASIVPRLHAVKIVEGSNNHIPDVADLLSKAESIRGDLHIMLTQLLFGDELAADYLICHLISSVYLRKDCLTLGAFSLNLTNFPKEYDNFTKDFYDILKEIIAKSHFLDITLDNLNDLNFVPKKDYDCDRLASGVLQLSNNTHLVLDETKLNTGQLAASGTKNYRSMSDLILFQKLSYDFKFYTMEYETDIPTLILSEGKSFIPCETQVVIKPDLEIKKIYPQVLEAAKQYLKDETRLNNIRHYVNTLKNSKFELSDQTIDLIHEDFVNLRQANKNFSADNLHSLLVLARLMSISHGFTELKPEIWKRSVEMEMERVNRLPKSKTE